MHAFVVVGKGGLSSHQATTRPTAATTSLLAAEDSTKDQVSTNAAVNGEGSGGLILQADAKSQLFASFSALSLADQYDAVLTGLCAKILDSASATPEAALTALEDPLSLMEEMNAKRIPASARSLMALVDVREFFCCFVFEKAKVLALLSFLLWEGNGVRLDYQKVNENASSLRNTLTH